MRTSGEPSASDIRKAQAQAVGGKKDRCNIGKSCSAACITRTDFCLVEIPLSPAQALSKVRSEVEGARSKQLPLFDVASKLKKKDIAAGVEEFRKKNQEGALKAIKSGNREEYEKYRKDAILFNRRLVEDGLTKKAGLVNVPTTWEKVQKTQQAYDKALDALTRKVRRAAALGNRAEYLKEERKILELQKRLAEKVGREKKYEKGLIWFESSESPRRAQDFLRSLRRNPILSRFSDIDYYAQGSRLELTTYVKNTSGGQSYRVEISLGSRGTDFSFTVNGRYDRPDNLSRRDGIAISLTVREAFREIAKSMRIGTVVTCFPYEDDGLGKERRSLYKKAGFNDGPDGNMYARVKDKAGRTSPSSEDEYRKFLEGGRFNFSELPGKGQG